MKKINRMIRKAGKGFRSLLLSLSVIIACSTSAYASTGAGASMDIWDWLDKALRDLYGKFVSVSTIAACVAASICLILMNFASDDRTVSTSWSTLKRIAISWIIMNVLGFIMTYLVNLTSGGSYSLPTP